MGNAMKYDADRVKMFGIYDKIDELKNNKLILKFSAGLDVVFIILINLLIKLLNVPNDVAIGFIMTIGIEAFYFMYFKPFSSISKINIDIEKLKKDLDEVIKKEETKSKTNEKEIDNVLKYYDKYKNYEIVKKLLIEGYSCKEIDDYLKQMDEFIKNNLSRNSEYDFSDNMNFDYVRKLK